MSGTRDSTLAGVMRADLLGWLPSRRGRVRADEVLRDAALPPEAAALVRDVVRRTRLWRNEKADVASELVSHFKEGLAAGAAAPDLVQAFGDPKQAATLIRRAKLRSRPLWWRTLRRARQVALAAIGAMVLAYAALAIRFWTGAPSPKRDYLAELAAPIKAIPESGRAWPRYREAILKIEKPALKPDGTRPHYLDLPAPERTAFFEKNAPALALLREATRLPHLGMPPSETIDPADRALWPDVEADDAIEFPMIAMLLPQLGEMRRLSELLAWDAKFAAEAGDSARAMEDLLATLRLSEHARESSTLICELVSISMTAQALERIRMILGERPDLWTDNQLRSLQGAVRSVRPEDALERWLRTERLGFEDVVQRIFTDDGNGDGRLTTKGVEAFKFLSTGLGGESADDALVRAAGPLLMAAGGTRRTTLSMHDDLVAMVREQAAIPLWLRENRADKRIAQLRRGAFVPHGSSLVAILFPSVESMLASFDTVELMRDATDAAIALELYKRSTGDWPATLSALVPDFLRAVPVDRFDGQPLRFRMIDGAPALYSVGTDRVDDGGSTPRDSFGDPINAWAAGWLPASEVARRQTLAHGHVDALPRGDWILFPAPPRTGDAPARRRNRRELSRSCPPARRERPSAHGRTPAHPPARQGRARLIDGARLRPRPAPARRAPGRFHRRNAAGARRQAHGRDRLEPRRTRAGDGDDRAQGPRLAAHDGRPPRRRLGPR